MCCFFFLPLMEIYVAKGWVFQGAVGLRIRVYDRIMCFVNCHFAAHLEAVNRRNADFDHVYRTMTFSRPTSIFSAAAGTVLYLFLYCSLALAMYLFWLVYRSGLPLVLSIAAGASSAAQMLRGANVCICFNFATRKVYYESIIVEVMFFSYALCLNRLALPTLMKGSLSYLRRTWSYFLVISTIDLMAYLMMRLGILCHKDALIGFGKEISFEQKWRLEMSFKDCVRQLLHFRPHTNLKDTKLV